MVDRCDLVGHKRSEDALAHVAEVNAVGRAKHGANVIYGRGVLVLAVSVGEQVPRRMIRDPGHGGRDRTVEQVEGDDALAIACRCHDW